MASASRKRERRRSRRLNTLLIAAFAAAIVIYLLNLEQHSWQRDRATGELPADAPVADATASNLLVTQYSDSGQIDYRLQAEKAAFYDADNATSDPSATGAADSFEIWQQNNGAGERPGYALLVEPELLFYRDGKAAINASARHARISYDGNSLTLEERVRLVDNRTLSTLETPVMFIDLALEQASGDRAVRMQSNGGKTITRAQGFHGNFQRQVWQLTSEVESVIKP